MAGCRGAVRRCIEVPSFMAEQSMAEQSVASRRKSAPTRRFSGTFASVRAGVVDRLPQLSAAIVGGIALCLSFPPVGWWFLAFFAFVALAWVLTRETTTLAGGFGYG